ncbi:CENP-Q, a CENPA-CAD centromere complex subunit-domain-containing protein [Xylaria palmicola]|nr:CENP-Q, a CENPA-CAD centromere complex subunit-domain-containing protein [Xylaria palmicola]
MDPPAANQKRKRGRPANASRDDEVRGASNSSTTMVPQNNPTDRSGAADSGAVDESPRPRKRGRPTRDNVPQEPQPERSEIQPRRRGPRQPSVVQDDDRPAKNGGGSVPPTGHKTAKRGRPRKADRRATPPEPEPEEADDEHEDEGNSSLLRRSKRNNRVVTGKPAVQEEVAQSKKQPRRTDKEQPEEAEPEAEGSTNSQAQKRKIKRPRNSQNPKPSMNEADPDPSPDRALPHRKRGRPSKAEGGARSSGMGAQSGPSRHRKGTADEEPQVSAPRQKPKGRRRSHEERDPSPALSSSPDSASSPPPYRHIAERTRHVTHEVIESKWSSLEPSSVENIAGLLRSVSLPTLLHVRPKQYALAENVLEKIVRGLCKRSARFPFPPTSTLPHREDELDFERTQSAVEGLISQLDPLQHSVELLRREKERAEKELEREYKVLDRLSTNARAEARERRDRLRKVHVLVPTPAYGSVTDDIDFLPADKAAGRVFAGVQGEEMLGLAGQINSHMESMRGNLQQIDGVLPAIAKSHALLKTTLQPHFGQKQLENILLGQVGQ